MDKRNKKADNAEFEGPNGLTKIRHIKISDLAFDNRNANKGTELGKELLHTSISKYGVGRGVLADKNLKLIAGNHAVKEMMAQGIENVIVVPTNGRTLVITQRTDIDKDSKAGHELALADNRVNQANLNFDLDVIRELDVEFDLDLADIAINIHEDGPHFPGSYEESDGAEQMETSYGERDNRISGDEPEEKGFEQTFFPLAIALSKAERLAFDTWKRENKLTTDTEAFQVMFKKVKNS